MSPSPHVAQLAHLSDQAHLPSVAHLLITMALIVTKWDRYRRTRKALNRLEQHLLADIGLSRDAAYNEARKPFWKD